MFMNKIKKCAAIDYVPKTRLQYPCYIVHTCTYPFYVWGTPCLPPLRRLVPAAVKRKLHITSLIHQDSFIQDKAIWIHPFYNLYSRTDDIVSTYSLSTLYCICLIVSFETWWKNVFCRRFLLVEVKLIIFWILRMLFYVHFKFTMTFKIFQSRPL